MVITSAMIFFYLSIRGNKVLCDWNDPGLAINLPQQYATGEQKPASLFVVESYDMFASMDKSNKCAYVVLCSPDISEPAFGEFSVAYVQTEKNAIQLFNQVNGIYCDLMEWGYKLRDALQATNPIKEVFSVGYSVYPRQFCLINHFFEIIAATPKYPVYNQKESPSPEEMLIDDAFINTEKYTDIFLFPIDIRDIYLLCLNIHTEHNFQIRVLAVVETNIVSEGEKKLFRELCEHIKMAYNRHIDGQLLRRQNDPIHSMLRQLLSEKSNIFDDQLWKSLSDYGWKREHQYQLILIDIVHQRDLKIFPVYLCVKLESEWKESYALKTDSGIVWIINLSLSLGKRTKTDLFQSLAYFLRDTVTKAGVSESFYDLVCIGEYYYQAETALRLGQRLNPDFWYYKFEDYIVDYILESMTKNISKENLYYKGIIKLKKYDEENGTNLLPTLRHFSECIFNTGTAAEKAYVHRTTLIRRLERIKAICGIDLTNVRDVIHVLITFQLMKE